MICIFHRQQEYSLQRDNHEILFSTSLKKKRYDEKKHNNKQLYDFCKVHIPCHTYGNLHILCDTKGIHVSFNGPNLVQSTMPPQDPIIVVAS